MSRGGAIQLFGVGVGEPGKSLNVTAASRLNCYYDIQPAPGDKSQIAVFGTPGMTEWATLEDPDKPAIAIHTTTDGLYLYYIQESVPGYPGTFTLYEIDVNGTSSPGGDFTVMSSTAKPEMADNGKQIVITTAYGIECYTIASNTLAPVYFDGVALQIIAASSVTFQDGYFIAAVTNDGVLFPNGVYISGLYDGTTWSSLDYAVPEFLADNIVKVISKNSLLYVFGTRSIEVWQNIGDLNFPFQRIAGAQSEYGLYSKQSLVSVGPALVGLFANRQNALSIMTITGYQPTDITPPDLAWRINQFSDPGDCAALSYSVAGHDFYQISWATDGETWLYDTLSGTWSRIKSGTNERSLALFGTPFKISTQMLVTDYAQGKLYLIDPESFEDNGETNYRELIGNHIFMPDRGMFTIKSISLDMEQGSAPTGVDMRVRLSLSRDGGHTFGEEYEDSSTTGEYTRFFQFNRLGRGRDIVPKIRMTDPCKFVLIGAAADIAPYGW